MIDSSKFHITIKKTILRSFVSALRYLPSMSCIIAKANVAAAMPQEIASNTLVILLFIFLTRNFVSFSFNPLKTAPEMIKIETYFSNFVNIVNIGCTTTKK